MPLDDRNKRAAAINIGLPFGRIFPNPDGSLTSQLDRAQMAFLARVATVAPPAPGPESPTSAQEADALAGRYGQVQTRLRAYWLSSDLSFEGDISDAFFDGTVTLDNRRVVIRTANFVIRPEFLPDDFSLENDLVSIGYEVYEKFTQTWIPYQVGIFTLDSPVEDYSSNGQLVWQVQAADLCIKLLSETVSAPYTVVAGTNYGDAVMAILDLFAFNYDLPDISAVTPVDFTWPPGTDYAQIVNDLLEGINHYSIWVTVDGTFTTAERIPPSDEAPDIVYSTTDEPKMIAGDTSWKRARVSAQITNRIVVKIEDPLRAPQAVSATNDDPLSPVSTVNKPSRTEELTVDRVVDEDTMQDIAAFLVLDAAARSRVGTLTTFPDPRRGAHDTYSLIIEDVEMQSKWQVATWTLPLVGGGLMTHTIESAEHVSISQEVIT